MTSRSEQLFSCPLPYKERPAEVESRHSSQLLMTYKWPAADDTEGVFASVYMITGNWLHGTNDSQHLYIMTLLHRLHF